ncbi:MAG: YCF48-related protein [Syntrophothermus sp.]
MYHIYSGYLKYSMCIFAIAVFSLNSVSGSDWKEIKPFRGATINVLFRTATNKVLAGSLSGELYASEDGGKSWKTIYNFSSQNFTGSISHICSAPSGVIFVNTNVERGIFRSTDDGKTWNQCKVISNPAQTVFSLECGNNNTLYAGRMDGLFISKDNGETWSKIISPEFSWYFRIIKFQNNSIYVAGDKLYISTDNGKTWTGKGLPTGAEIRSLVIFNENEMMLMSSFPVVFLNNPGIFYSSDKGSTWKKIVDGSALTGQSRLKENQGNLYLTSDLGRIYVSSDKGASWETVTANLTGTNISDIIFSDKEILASAWGGGILRTDAGSSSWSLSNEGLPKIKNKAMIGRDDGKLIIAGKAGIYLYDKSTEKYQSLNYTNGTISEITDILVMPDNSLLASNYTEGILKSVDNGNTWRLISTPWEVSGTKIFQKGPRNDIYIYGVNPAGLYTYSHSNGKWNFVSSDFPNAVSMCFDGDVSYLSSGNGFYKSVDSCRTWKLQLVSDNAINVVKALKPGNIMTCTRMGGIRYSNDSGNSWIENNASPLYGLNFNDAALLNDGRILLAADRGLLESADSGISWNHVAEFRNINVTKIIKTDNGNFVLTNDGIYEYAGIASSVNLSSIISEFSLYQNYPNPFNPTTTISYSLPKETHIELKVFDMLGREVTTLVNKEQTAGEHKVQFEGSSLPSGVYIYTIQAGMFRDSKKLLLLK